MRRIWIWSAPAALVFLAGIFAWHEFAAREGPNGIGGREPVRGAGALRAIDPPRRLPGFRFVDGSGAERTLAEFRDKTLLVNIWATWCPPCREEMPSLDRLQRLLGGDNFQVLVISTDLHGVQPVQDFFRQIGVASLEAFVDLNGEAQNALQITGLPTTLVIDGSGSATAVRLGPAQWDSEEVVAEIEARISTGPGLKNR